MITVKTVGDGACPSEVFFELPSAIYAGDPFRARRPVESVARPLDVAVNPYWRQAERELFVAFENDRPVGRIVAINDPEFAADRRGGVPGFFGFFECFDNAPAANALFAATETWLAARGRKLALGPFSPTPDAYDFGTLVEGFSLPQNSGEPFNLSYYPKLFETGGFRKLCDLFSFKHAFSNNPVWEKMMARLGRHLRSQEKTRVRSFDPANFERDAKILHDILNESYAEIELFSRVPFAYQKFIIEEYARPEDTRFFLIVEVDGQPAGVNMLAPDYDELLHGDAGPENRKILGIRTGEFCVAPQFRKTAAAAALFHASWELAVKEGFQWAEMSFQEESNVTIQRMLESFGAVRSKRFRLYEKDFG